jgi:hypothetical protein
MSSNAYSFPVAVSRLGSTEDSREPQNNRAIAWIRDQPGGLVAVVTPQMRFAGERLARFIGNSDVEHFSWKGFSPHRLTGRRVIYAWPDRQHLNDLYGIAVDALVVIEWGEPETAEWIDLANPIVLLPGASNSHSLRLKLVDKVDPLPKDVERILEYVAGMAAGYSSGLKWNEEDKLKADMMNQPERWSNVTPEGVRAKCHELGMRPNDIDTIVDFVQRRREGRRFNVQSSYRGFHFTDS